MALGFGPETKNRLTLAPFLWTPQTKKHGDCSKLLYLETAILRGKKYFRKSSRFRRRALFIAKVRKSQLLSTRVIREMRFDNSSCKVATFQHSSSTCNARPQLRLASRKIAVPVPNALPQLQLVSRNFSVQDQVNARNALPQLQLEVASSQYPAGKLLTRTFRTTPLYIMEKAWYLQCVASIGAVIQHSCENPVREKKHEVKWRWALFEKRIRMRAIFRKQPRRSRSWTWPLSLGSVFGGPAVSAGRQLRVESNWLQTCSLQIFPFEHCKKQLTRIINNTFGSHRP